jgi:hypothetical protein
VISFLDNFEKFLISKRSDSIPRMIKGARVMGSHFIDSFWPLKWITSSSDLPLLPNPGLERRTNVVRRVDRINKEIFVLIEMVGTGKFRP